MKTQSHDFLTGEPDSGSENQLPRKAKWAPIFFSQIKDVC